MKLTKKAKEWFENETEMDVELMIQMGVITGHRVMVMYKEHYGRKKRKLA